MTNLNYPLDSIFDNNDEIPEHVEEQELQLKEEELIKMNMETWTHSCDFNQFRTTCTTLQHCGKIHQKGSI